MDTEGRLYTVHNLFIGVVIRRYYPQLMACLTNLLAFDCRRLDVLPAPFSDNTLLNRASRTRWTVGMRKAPGREGLSCWAEKPDCCLVSGTLHCARKRAALPGPPSPIHWFFFSITPASSFLKCLELHFLSPNMSRQHINFGKKCWVIFKRLSTVKCQPSKCLQ